MGRKPELHYTGGDRRKLTMELFFDTYEKENEDVRVYTSQLVKLLVPTTNQRNDGKRPPAELLQLGQDERYRDPGA